MTIHAKGEVMEKRQGGLGRGLGALLGESSRDMRPERTDGLRSLPINKIVANAQQPRRNFHSEGLADLERSIRELGVLSPIMVRTKGDGYELIAGERRLRAARAAGLTLIPALVRDVDDRASLELAIVENLQRENLDPIEEAMGFADLMRDYEFTQDRLAARLGKSRPAITNALRLLELPDEVKLFVHQGKLTAGHARALLALPESDRIACAEHAAREGSSVREVERIAKEKRLPKLAKSPAAPISSMPPADRAERTAAEDLMRQRFGTAVRIVGDSRGKIELDFFNADDLVRIVDLLTGSEA